MRMTVETGIISVYVSVQMQGDVKEEYDPIYIYFWPGLGDMGKTIITLSFFISVDNYIDGSSILS